MIFFAGLLKNLACIRCCYEGREDKAFDFEYRFDSVSKQITKTYVHIFPQKNLVERILPHNISQTALRNLS